MVAKSELTPLECFMKMRASLKDEPAVYFFTGQFYRKVDLREANGEYQPTGGWAPPNDPIFRIAGFNIARAYFDPAIPGPGGTKSPGYYLLTREVMFYCDPKTGEIMNEWENPFVPAVSDGSGGTVRKKVQVLHVDNDPVNQAMTEATPEYYKPLPLGDDWMIYELDVWLKYPSPLAGGKLNRFSASDTYQAAECFRFVADRKQLLDPTTDKVDNVVVSWTRIGQYLPWMHMGEAPGGVVCIASGHRVPSGFDGLPEFIKKEVKAKYPKYVEPPQGKYPTPNVNETSWTFFKKELEAGRYIPTQIP